MYRHDLLVAMRVLNTLEHEVIQAEYESWLQDENRRCGQVEVMLRDGNSSTSEHSMDSAGSEERAHEEHMKELGRWYAEYCGSCREEQARIEDANRGYMAVR